MFNQELYQNKYHIKSTRLPHWDYSWPGMYYVTINTKDNTRHFGDIINGQMYYSPIGILAKKYWQDISKHFINVGLDEYNVMPNHIHGIVVLKETKEFRLSVETRDLASLRRNEFGPLKPQSLHAVIHAYKSSLKRWCNQNGFQHFLWQPRFYEHIIRHNKDLNRIREYIRNNPLKWEYDRNNF